MPKKAKMTNWIEEEEDLLSFKSPPAPVLWIRELRILDHIEPHLTSVIRKVEFSLGLNIVWARPSNPDEPDPRARGRGHDVGKSTLCRLIRHILGEKTYGTDTTRWALSAAKDLSRTWTVGELVVRNKPCTVARALYAGGRSFAVRGATIDEALVSDRKDRMKLEDFYAWLESEMLRDLPIRSFDLEGSRPLQWLHLLEWLARDQETHLANTFSWRDQASNSHSPDLSVADGWFLTRCVLGVINSKEREIISTRATLNDEKNEVDADLRFLGRQVQEAMDNARASLPNGDDLPTIAEPLFINQVVTRAEKLVETKRIEIESTIEKLDLAGAESALETAIQNLAIAKNQHETLKDELGVERDRMKRLGSSKKLPTLNELDKILAELKPERSHCEVPANIALFQCEVLRKYRERHGLPDPVPEGIAEQVAHLRVECGVRIEKKQKDLRLVASRLKSSEKAEATARATVTDRRARRDALIKELSEVTPEVERWRIRAEDAKSAYALMVESKSKLRSIAKTVRELKAAQDEIQERSKSQQAKIAAYYQALGRLLKGDDVDAELKFTRDEIRARIGSGGGAYTALSSLVFDYTSLVARLKGIGYHPGFLMHDSPRESDMEPSLYRPIFSLIKRIADHAPNAFQYIVTTTEPPPKDLMRGHLSLELDGSSDEGYLFRRRF